MNPNRSRDIQCFDPKQEYAVCERRLPHWSQAGTVSFLTFRLWDSIPQPVLNRWLKERWDWLRQHGVDPHAGNWRSEVERLAIAEQRDFHDTVMNRWNDDLDACHGGCILRRSELAKIVSDSFDHFNGDRYELTDYVVMPNHVHVLVAFPDEAALLKQCTSWKHFTATRINKVLGLSGPLWQQDGFDHLVRSPESFDHFRRYIADNPRRANLPAGAAAHYSKPL